jgi:hypothetical protein
MTSILTTQDGNHIVADFTGSASFPSRAAAEQEIRRREDLRQQSEIQARWIVTETFKDWDGQTIKAGTKAEKLVIRGGSKRGVRFFNLISAGRVISVTEGRPPVALIEHWENQHGRFA